MENNSGNNAEVQNEGQEKLFTQEQVNAIIGKRLSEARAGSNSDIERRERELAEREMNLKARELLAEAGLPQSLGDVLRYEDEESLKKAVETMTNLRGFKPTAEKPKKIIDENRLPERTRYEEPDQIRHAMGLDG